MVADMAIANQFYRTKDEDEKQQLAQAYKDSIVEYGDNISHIKFPEILMPSVNENFADGKKPGRKGLSKRVGIPKGATLSQLEKIAKNSSGEKRRMAQWQLNMRRGKNKNK
jgi:hypothetical protein